jgi:hypothetical protein
MTRRELAPLEGTKGRARDAGRKGFSVGVRGFGHARDGDYGVTVCVRPSSFFSFNALAVPFASRIT